MARNSSRKLLLVFLVPFLFLVTLKTHRTYAGGGDQPHYLLIAESLLSDSDLRMKNQYPTEYSFLPHFDPPGHCVPTRFGDLFPIHDIGLPVLMLPLLKIVHVVIPQIPSTVLQKMHMDPLNFCVAIFSYQSMVVAGLLSVLFFYYFLSYGFTEQESFFFSLLAILTPPIVTHGYLFFTEIYSAAVLLGLVLVYRSKLISIGSSMLYSFGIFLLSWLHIKNQLLVSVLCLAWFLRGVQFRKARLSIIPGIVFVLALTLRSLINWHYFGRFSLTGGWGNPHLSIFNLPHSLAGILFDREAGLFFCNPIFFCLPVALWLSWYRRKEWVRFEGLLVFTYTMTILSFDNWWAGWSPAARHLVPIIPLLWFPLAELIRVVEQSGNAFSRYSVRMFLGLGIIVSLVLWQYPQLGWYQGNGINRWMHILVIHGWEWQFLLPNVSTTGSFYSSSLLYWILLCVVGTVRICFTLRNSLAGRSE